MVILQSMIPNGVLYPGVEHDLLNYQKDLGMKTKIEILPFASEITDGKKMPIVAKAKEGVQVEKAKVKK